MHDRVLMGNKIATTPFTLEPSWQAALHDELQEPYIAALAEFLARERAAPLPIYPPEDLVFNAFWKTPYDKVKVVIVGQDPYHGPGQAHGLCFSVPKGVPPPPSLKNIFKELQSDLGLPIPSHGCLTSWAEQGVLLLNATLTVRDAEPLAHHGKGWERFTDAVIKLLCSRPKNPVIFVLWGNSAQKKFRHICDTNISSDLVLTSAHPSPLSAYHGFLGCRHFSQINALLQKLGEKQIDWKID